MRDARRLWPPGLRKKFFSEENNQKTFSGAVADHAGGTNT
jgi:hypothetical protein